MNALAKGQSHFLDLSDVSADELRRVLHHSARIKSGRRKGVVAAEKPLEGKVLAMIFDKPSTRTRVKPCARSSRRPGLSRLI